MLFSQRSLPTLRGLLSCGVWDFSFPAFWTFWATISLFTCLVLSTEGCALYSATGSVPVVKTCGIPSDQQGTITGHWLGTPIPIALHQGDFTATETAAITAAADSWNQFFSSSQNIKTLDYGGNPTSPNVSQAYNPALTGSPCSLRITQGNQFTGQVVIYKATGWPANYPQSAMALTTTCYSPASPYPIFYAAIMEINYKNFFVTGGKNPDLQSIVLHELGHLHGLYHSCESFTRAGTPNCTDPNINSDYILASMFPTFTFDSTGIGQQKRNLGTNDESRANCLYNGPSGPAPLSTPVATTTTASTSN